MSEKYPATPRDNWKSVKIPLKEHERIRQLHDQGFTIKQLAEMYDVSITPIRSAIYPEKYQQQIKKSVKRHQEKWESDPDYRRKLLDYQNSWNRKRYSDNPKYKEWSDTTNSKNSKLFRKNAHNAIKENELLEDEILRLRHVMNNNGTVGVES